MSLLDDEERRRAERLRIEAVRQRFVAARALTRLLLARYCGVSPSALDFTNGARGKPRLELSTERSTLHYNTAHSGGTVAVAVASSELGVDVESLRPVPNLDRLVARVCSEFEREQLYGLPAPDRETAFLALWTCKEAYLKAVGSGIAMPLKQVEVALDPPRLVRISNDPHAASQWTLLRAGESGPTVCTIAIRGAGWRLVGRRFEWGMS